jgi:type II secretory pathway pseudopilin PulG
MVLLIVGIIAGGMLKGKAIITSAQVRSVAADIQVIRLAYSNYVSSYGALPGDDSGASSRFGATSNGDGDGKISQSDADRVFQHLHAAGLIEKEEFKSPSIGGTYSVISEGDAAKLKIAKDGKAFISREQLITLKSKVTELIGDQESAIETDPTSISTESSQKYIVKVRLDGIGN